MAFTVENEEDDKEQDRVHQDDTRETMTSHEEAAIEGDEGADTHTHDLPEAVTTSNEDTQRVHTLNGDCEKTNTIVEIRSSSSTIVLVFSQSPCNV